MAVNHKITGLAFAFAVGISLSYYSYQWLTGNPQRAEQRATEEAVVYRSRELLRTQIAGGGDLDIADALNRVPEAGKVYIFPNPSGWELSGQYRRPDERRWHPYLMQLSAEVELLRLSVRDDDPALVERARADPLLEIMPAR